MTTPSPRVEVPRILTDEMHAAFMRSFTLGLPGVRLPDAIDEAWKAAIAASPQASELSLSQDESPFGIFKIDHEGNKTRIEEIDFYNDDKTTDVVERVADALAELYAMRTPNHLFRALRIEMANAAISAMKESNPPLDMAELDEAIEWAQQSLFGHHGKYHPIILQAARLYRDGRG